MEDKEQDGELAVLKLDATVKDHSCTKPITSSRDWLEVRDVMSKDVAIISSSQTIIAASRMMSDRSISCVVVVERDKVVGILTETDLLKKIAVEGDGFYEKPIAEIMTASVETVSDSVSVLSASKIMQDKNIKRLPVLADEQLVGIVTQTDLTRSLAHYGTWRDVAEIMTTNIYKIQRHVSVAEAAKVMSLEGISSVVVMDGEDVVGVLTHRDLLTKILAEERDPQHTNVETAMSYPPICVPPTYSVFSASRTMEERRIRRLVVKDNKALLGIVTQTDIFAAIKNKLQAEEEKNHRLLEQSPSCLFTTDLEGRITFANPAFMNLFEISDAQELINQPFLAEPFWIDPSERELFMDGYNKWRFESSELALQSVNGKELCVTVFSNFTTNAHGEINGRQGILYDLSERKEAEKRQEKLIVYLKRSNQELEDFAYMISHDLKTPLRGIVTLADWLTDDYTEKLGEEGAEKLVLLRGRVNRLYDMVDGILEYCKVGDAKKKWSYIYLNELVVDVINMLNVPDHMDITIEDELPIVYANPTQTAQVFQNLLSNAIQYTDKPCGRIRIRCTEEDRFWKFKIMDNGPGIEEEHFEKIFKMFQTLTPRDQFESTGIGLALVKKVIEVCGGTIWVESVVGQGSTFIFTLPKQHATAESAEGEDNDITSHLALKGIK